MDRGGVSVANNSKITIFVSGEAILIGNPREFSPSARILAFLWSSSNLLIHFGSSATNPNEAIIFGDRSETDILAGNRAGILTAMILTGVTTRKMIDDLKKNIGSNNKEKIPDLVFNNLDEIFK